MGMIECKADKAKIEGSFAIDKPKNGKGDDESVMPKNDAQWQFWLISEKKLSGELGPMPDPSFSLSRRRREARAIRENKEKEAKTQSR
jgi:hypothetical protein